MVITADSHNKAVTRKLNQRYMNKSAQGKLGYEPLGCITSAVGTSCKCFHPMVN